MHNVGWLGATLIGGLAGWLVSMLREMRYGVVLILAIIVIGVGSAILAYFNMALSDTYMRYFLPCSFGVCILIVLVRLARR